jgi:hypothetical protein
MTVGLPLMAASASLPSLLLASLTVQVFISA